MLIKVLSDERVELIEKKILEAELNNVKLQDELLDHICCDIEEEMWEGAAFEDAFSKIWKKNGQ